MKKEDEKNLKKPYNRWYFTFLAFLAMISAIFLPILSAGIVVFISAFFMLYKIKRK